MDTKIKGKQNKVLAQIEKVKESENKEPLKNLSAVNDAGIQIEEKNSVM